MGTIVVTGGTDGMGAALVRHYLRQGDTVAAVGRSRPKFEALVAALTKDGVPDAAERARFVQADLSLIAEARRVVKEITARHEQVDALILAASYIRQKRHLTPEGHEASWVLFFVSKYVLVTGLRPLLEKAPRPVVVNTSVPGAKPGAINWDDLELSAGFTFSRSNRQQRRANELLGILATEHSPVSYLTWGPKTLVKTSFAGDVHGLMKLGSVVLTPLLGQPADTAVRPIVTLIATPPPGRTAYRGPNPVPLINGPDDPTDAHRLARAMATLGVE
ncbi:SDR family NAD(P)-dependent oxidoreductase [Sphaerisporangium sp. TRM90804]|uniref:SDR family NAD(P)-dependent oxidoreductase n=1 Tax=Sphaerisporangium sp. TRM90804 TaxID=3031113 RepID=UPI002447994D|nr:SDR family NAD(P)-dependent oxidoreductase [Sphaerisporangium sp. TRM90804]MDH2428144.1 SDR family NAD(P)-dependent oxidoreductase [Sphaerisporangium sp. TRM90804]